MSIQSTVNRTDYDGDGSTAVYPYTFRLILASHLVVSVVADADPTNIITLVQDVDYSLDPAEIGNENGDVTLIDASQAWIDGSSFLDTGWHLTLRRVLPLTQPTDFRNQGPFYAKNHETAVDRVTMILQQHQDEIDRSMKLPETQNPGAFDPTLPAIGVADADKSIIVNPTGDGLTLGPTAADIAAAAPNAAAAAASAATATAAAAAAAASAASVLYVWGGAVGGTPDAITLTPTPALIAYGAGNKLAFVATGTNTGAVTADVSGLGAQAIKSEDGDALVAGEILNGTLYYITYDGTNFRLGDAIVTTTKGDLQGHGATEPIRVAVGTNGQVLLADSAAPSGVAWGDSAITPAIITGQTSDPTPAANDSVLTYDTSAGALKKVALSALGAVVGTASIAAGSYAGDGAGSKVVTHGLSVTPKFIYILEVSSGSSAVVIFPSVSGNLYDVKDGFDRGAGDIDTFTSTTFTVHSTGQDWNQAAASYRFFVAG